MSILKAIAGGFSTLLASVLVVAALFVVFGPRFGFETHPVLSGSMEPALPSGSVIVTHAVPVREITVGDTITFKSGETLVTHRVVGIVHKEGDPTPWFVTKGDANSEPDANPVSPRGERAPKTVMYIPEIGKLSSIVKNRTAFPFLVGIPTLLLMLVCARELWQGVNEEKGKRALRTSNAQGKE